MNKFKKVIMVRHGETIWNLEKRIQGHSNTTLTQNGILQAEKTGKKLTEYNIEEIYSSNLGRAMQTAEVINKYLVLNIYFEKNLRERKYGIFEGISFMELQEKYPEISEKLYSHDANFVLPEGESFCEFAKRIFCSMNSIVENSAAKTILIVTHGGVLEGFFYKVIGLPMNSKRCFSLLNSSINVFSYENNAWRLDSWGITDHLSSEAILSL